MGYGMPSSKHGYGLRFFRKIIWPLSLFLMVGAVFAQAIGAGNEATEINVPKKLKKKLKSFEPSALVSISRDEYLVASDDTTKQDDAMLFLMSAEGEVNKNPIYFDGLETMTDIESLSMEDGYLYALGSLSRNKKGKELPERNLLARSRLNGAVLSSTESVELRSVLLEALSNAKDSRLQSLKKDLNRLLETEASFIKNGRFYLGLKDPQPKAGVALVLDIGRVEELFEGREPAVEVAFELRFGGKHKLSDIIAAGDKFYLTTTMEAGGGSLWSYTPIDGVLTELRSYSELKPEGIAQGERAGELLVVFDQGEEAAMFKLERL